MQLWVIHTFFYSSLDVIRFGGELGVGWAGFEEGHFCTHRQFLTEPTQKGGHPPNYSIVNGKWTVVVDSSSRI